MLHAGIYLYILVVIVLIFTRIYNVDKVSLIVKTILSIILITFVVISCSKEKFIMLSIVFSSIADIFLGINRIEKKSSYLFYTALVLVTFSQIFLLIASIILIKFNIYCIILSTIMNIILYNCFKRNCKMETMQKICMAYAYIFLLVVSNTFLNIKSLNIMYTVAVFTYWISDIVLFIQKFISKKNKTLLDVINKLMYYTAQMLFILYIQI